ncbi:DUF4434 domain-containing protein [Nonomuraea rhodomycinica]|uniref:DUF4434 domain-containing protein n=1 Tax=Nonomuraea rhodomycinica TaxID=1712872 RepID=A0A7Y6IN58_9ACTN|nr:DUF4434 domain-containing protein [Nonomuraea rhodomycinica]NUW41332.1 hypothetical protein [Nonomuraea rhodomycinica]
MAVLAVRHRARFVLQAVGVFAAVAVVAAAGLLWGLGAAPRTGAPGCPPRDTRVTAPYAISGYWMEPRPDRCDTRRTLQAVHAAGGDTIITFGPRFAAARVDGAGRVLAAERGETARTPVADEAGEGDTAGGPAAEAEPVRTPAVETEPGLRPDPVFAGCVERGRPCYLAARDAVRGQQIRRVFTYVTSESLGPGALRCPGLDRRIDGGGRVYYRLLLGPSCRSGPYDLVLVATDGDGVGNLLEEAAAYGMRVYPGLPAAPQDPARPWQPDAASTDALNAFTERVLTGYRERFGASPALAGVYQSFELAMRDRGPRDPVLALYRAQHAVAAAVLPGRTIVVSPYWDARRWRGFPPSVVGAGFADIAATRAGLPMAIAVQDGRGVGKVPVYGAGQDGEPVDTRLVPVAGAVPYRRAYYGSTADYVAAAARRAGPGAELWVNVEVFEPTPVPGECGRSDPLPLRGRAAKSRVDRQVMAVGRYATKIIAYGWDPFLTCRDRPGAPSLADAITAGWNDPLVMDATRRTVGGRDGIEVRGLNLGGGTLRLTYQEAGGAVRTATLTPEPGADARDDGRAEDGGGRSDGGGRGREGRSGGVARERVWAPFDPAVIAPGRPWLMVTAVNGAGRTSGAGFTFR